ncbi:ribonuclease E activity regulator RraA [soil metagenome]
MSFKTADLSDDHSAILKVPADIFQSYGSKQAFHGEVVTVKVFEDNVLVKAQLETDGRGKVLVVDGGGSVRCALLGDNVAALAVKNGWEGVVINGAIRDAGDIDCMNVAIKALGTHPFKSIKKGEGDVNIPVSFGGVTFYPGEYLYSDADGIIVAPNPIH